METRVLTNSATVLDDPIGHKSAYVSPKTDLLSPFNATLCNCDFSFLSTAILKCAEDGAQEKVGGDGKVSGFY